MTIRPTDPTGDILPTPSLSALRRGPEAVAALLRCRLSLWAGEWWENPAHGNRLLSLLEASRLTEADAPAILSYLTAYLSSAPGVLALEDAAVTCEPRRLTFSCRVRAEEGTAPLSYSLSL